MNSIFKKPKVTNNLGRNGFDLSMRRCFTSPLGMLLPVWKDIANPGDKYKLNSSAFIRTEPVQTAAFTRFKAHTEYFFVPMEQIYTFWNEFYNGTQDLDTSFVSSDSRSTNFAFPYFNVQSVGPYLFFYSDNTKPYYAQLIRDEFSTPYAWNFRRLWDMFGYGSLTDVQSASPLYFCPFFHLAYHKIFYSFYNNSSFFLNKTELYNVDAYHGKILPDDVLSPIVSTIHYRPYRVDYFTNIQPAPLFNNNFVNSANASFFDAVDQRLLNPEVGIDGSNVINSSNPVGQYVNSDATSHILLNSTINQSGDLYSANLSAGNLRALFAYEKLMRITASTGTRYDQQTLAHFGFSVPKGISRDAYFLGAITTDVNISEVVATASTGATETVDGKEEPLAGSTIGDMAGKGFGNGGNGKDINFTAPCHGIIMALFSIEPIVDYASMFCETSNRYRNSLDFYHPELDNVGMVPVYNVFGKSFGLYDVPNSDMIGGWTYRYSELKTKVDVVNEGFYATHRHDWVSYKQGGYSDPIHVTEQGFEPSLEYLFFVSPSYADDIFLTDYLPNSVLRINSNKWSETDVLPQSIYRGDNFLISMDIKAFKTSCMSVHSLPKLF